MYVIQTFSTLSSFLSSRMFLEKELYLYQVLFFCIFVRAVDVTFDTKLSKRAVNTKCQRIFDLNKRRKHYLRRNVFFKVF